MPESKKIKVSIVILLVVVILMSFKLIVYADSIEDNLDLFNPKSDQITESELKEKAEIILGVVNVVGIIVSVATIIIVGIKYLLGSVEEKAEYKKTMITYFIGAILIFSIITVSNVLYNIGASL